MNNLGDSSVNPSLSRILQTMPEDKHVVLFVVSAKGLEVAGRTLNVKKVNLTDASKVAKLNKYREEHRLIITIEKGGQLCANISERMAKELAEKNQRLAIDGKELNVEKIDDQEYLDELSKISEAIQQTLENAESRSKRTKEFPPSHVEKFPLLMPSDIQVLRLLLKIEGIPDKVKQKIIQRMIENQREVERQRKEKEEQDRVKSLDIKEREIKRSIIKEEIKKTEIKDQDTTLDLTKEIVKKAERLN